MTRKTTTKAGAPNYCALYKNLQEDYAASNKRHKALSTSFDSALKEKLNLEAHARNNKETMAAWGMQIDCLTGEKEILEDDIAKLENNLMKMTAAACFFICLACLASVLVFVAGMR